MDAKEETTPLPPSPTSSDWRLLALLVLAVIPLRAWHVYNAEVVARDCIGYIRYGLQFEQQPWQEVVKGNHQHPGYAFAIWAVSIPVRNFVGISAESMQFCAQFASSLAAVFLIFPMFYLGKILFDRHVAFWGTLLFQILPIGGHLLSDGLSESLFFFLCACSLLYAAKSMQRPSVWAFVVCGVFGGLAYWTRPEGLLIPFVTGCALVIRQLMPSQRVAWNRFVSYGCSLTAAVVLVGCPYVLATGKITNKPSKDIIFGQINGSAGAAELQDGPANPHSVEAASVFGASISKKGSPLRRLSDTLWKFLVEIAQALHYYAWVPALFAIWRHRRRLKQLPAFWVVLLFCLAQTAVVFALAMQAGYVSYRHIMMIVFFGSFCAAAGVQIAAVEYSEYLEKRRGESRWSASQLTVMAMLVIFATCIPKALNPMHRDREGHHAAGLWLAKQVKPGDMVDDDHCLSHYYAGMVFREGAKEWQADRPTAKTYIVITRSSRRHVDKKRREREAEIQAQNGRIVYHWPPHQIPNEARVVIYAAPKNSH